jgi:hypothetical protein
MYFLMDAHEFEELGTHLPVAPNTESSVCSQKLDEHFWNNF